MAFVAPNLSKVVGPTVAAKLMGKVSSKQKPWFKCGGSSSVATLLV